MMGAQNAVPSPATWLLPWGLPVLVGTLLFGMLSVWLGQDPSIQNLEHSLAAPDVRHWLGTDHLGRDLLARLCEAVRVSFWLALGSALLAVSLGTSLGLWAA